jgi:hypothetical protein
VELTFTATATDEDIPTLTYSLADGISGSVPPGASINATSGLFSWTPTEAQGPGDYTFDVVVTDNEPTPLTDFETITVTVNEVNVAPVLDAIGAQSVAQEVELAFTITANDADLPANTLTFSLDAGAPTGASITPGGDFTWTPTTTQGPGDFQITVPRRTWTILKPSR